MRSSHLKALYGKYQTLKTVAAQKIFVIVAILTACLSDQSATAASKGKAKTPVKVNEGVALYNQGKYSEALPILLKTIKANPSDPLYHYYLGCCYDRLHSEGSAMGQFMWVSKHSKNQQLKQYAETALHGSSSNSARATSAPAHSDNESQGSDADATAGNTASNDSNDSVTSSRQPYGKAKIYFFESANRASQQFAPVFERAARTYRGSLNFERLDVSAPATRSMIAKYKVNTFPHLIYVDGKGDEIYNEGPGSFNLRLTELLGK